MTRIEIFEDYELLIFSKKDIELIQQISINNFYGHIDREDMISILFDKAFVTGSTHTLKLLQIAVSDLNHYSKRKKMRAYVELVREI